MLTVAYLANQFPAASEPYVADEIRELRRRGVTVIPCSARRVAGDAETLHLLPLQFGLLWRAAALCLSRFPLLVEILLELLRGREPLYRCFPALVHTGLGAYYALLLQGRDVTHIHVHHGYFSSWIAMVAARLMGIPFSMTLHGSDVLVHQAFLGLKLQHCKFCLTISRFNQRYLLATYPEVPAGKVRVQRLGVEAVKPGIEGEKLQNDSQFILLSVGRLHHVKDHAFLLRGCAELKRRGVWFLCLIAGDGPERGSLERLARGLQLGGSVVFLGHVPHEKLDAYYSICDLVVLTSRSEGIPLVLMEAMARSRLVLAPDITGIPELVLDGQTGFLYRPGSLDDFVERAEAISRMRFGLTSLRRRARQHVLEHFNRESNLEKFGEVFSMLLGSEAETPSHEDLVLQQI